MALTGCSTTNINNAEVAYDDGAYGKYLYQVSPNEDSGYSDIFVYSSDSEGVIYYPWKMVAKMKDGQVSDAHIEYPINVVFAGKRTLDAKLKINDGSIEDVMYSLKSRFDIGDINGELSAFYMHSQNLNDESIDIGIPVSKFDSEMENNIAPCSINAKNYILRGGSCVTDEYNITKPVSGFFAIKHEGGTISGSLSRAPNNVLQKFGEKEGLILDSGYIIAGDNYDKIIKIHRDLVAELR